VVWQVGAGRGATAQPLAAGGRLYVATARSNVKAFELTTGRELWSRGLARGFQASPRLGGDLLVVVSPHPDATAYALDPRTGLTRWTRKVGDVSQPPLVEEARAFFVSLGGWIRAVDTRTGDQIWETRAEGVFPGGSLLADGDLIVLSAAGTLVRLDPATGRRLGSLDLGSPATPELVPLPGGGFAAATFDGRIRSFDHELAAGTLDVSSAPLQRAPAAGPGLLVAAGKDRRLRAYALPSGTPLWERDLDALAAAPPAVSPDGGRVAVADLAGAVWTLAAADGAVLGRAELAGAAATPVWVEGRLAVVTDRGTLALLDAGPGAGTSAPATAASGAPEAPAQ
jgi:outer membrane protein assembly factor BamB